MSNSLNAAAERCLELLIFEGYSWTQVVKALRAKVVAPPGYYWKRRSRGWYVEEVPNNTTPYKPWPARALTRDQVLAYQGLPEDIQDAQVVADILHDLQLTELKMRELNKLFRKAKASGNLFKMMETYRGHQIHYGKVVVAMVGSHSVINWHSVVKELRRRHPELRGELDDLRIRHTKVEATVRRALEGHEPWGKRRRDLKVDAVKHIDDDALRKELGLNASVRTAGIWQKFLDKVFSPLLKRMIRVSKSRIKALAPLGKADYIRILPREAQATRPRLAANLWYDQVGEYEDATYKGDPDVYDSYDALVHAGYLQALSEFSKILKGRWSDPYAIVKSYERSLEKAAKLKGYRKAVSLARKRTIPQMTKLAGMLQGIMDAKVYLEEMGG